MTSEPAGPPRPPDPPLSEPSPATSGVSSGTTEAPTASDAASGATEPGVFPPPGPPPGAYPPPRQPGAYAGTSFPLRHGLVRPRQGRYLAGVCAAIGRATNTDPVLWRVLLAVLGFFGGVGLLVYLVVWLITPAEGDSASPVEGLLGRGRSGTPAVLVIVLGVLIALVFGLIVTDAFRAVLLGAAVLLGGALLLNRASNGRPAPVGGTGPVGDTGPVGGTGPIGGVGFGATPATDPPPGTPSGPPFGPPPGPPPAGGSSPIGPPVADDLGALLPGPYPPVGPVHPAYAAAVPSGASTTYAQVAPPGPDPGPRGTLSESEAPTAPLGFPVPPAPPAGGYRPPFAPHGPYGGGPPPPPLNPFPPVPPPPKPPKQRSALGAATFSMVLVVLGVVTALDLSNTVAVGPSAYFAGALVTVALGLLVGAWFGRARWLIALGLALSAALIISTAAESYDQSNVGDETVWAPQNLDDVAARYEVNFGDAMLDLTAIDFTGQDRAIAVETNIGSVDVVVPPQVDVTATVEVGAGEARVFNNEWSGFGRPAAGVTDHGADGPGGGKLTLTVRVNAGDVEVSR